MFTLLQTLVPYISSCVVKIFILIGSHGPPKRNFPEDIFSQDFGDLTNISVPFLYPVLEPITFGFVTPNITAEIMCARENLIPMNSTKQFPHLNIVSMHNQNVFIRMGTIPLFRAVAF